MKNGFTLLVLAGFLLTACAPTVSPGVTGDWILVSYGPPSGLQSAAPDVDTLIQFKTDGTLSGNVGCNGFGGEYEVKGSSIDFSRVLATLMFCDGPVGEQETFTLRVISGSASFALDGDTLRITSADGSSVIVLARK